MSSKLTPEYKTKTLDRIFRRGERQGDCLVWTGAKLPTGYGMTTIIYPEGKSRSIGVHRAAWILLNTYPRFLPRNIHIHHTCENQACFNPEHLEILTAPEHISYHHGPGGSLGWEGSRRLLDKIEADREFARSLLE